MPGSFSGPKTKSPSTSSTEISGHPSELNTAEAYGRSVALVVLQGDPGGRLLPAAEVGERHRLAHLVLADRDDELVDAVYRGAVDGGDRVADADAGVLGGRAVDEPLHGRALPPG